MYLQAFVRLSEKKKLNLQAMKFKQFLKGRVGFLCLSEVVLILHRHKGRRE